LKKDETRDGGLKPGPRGGGGGGGDSVEKGSVPNPSLRQQRETEARNTNCMR